MRDCNQTEGGDIMIPIVRLADMHGGLLVGTGENNKGGAETDCIFHL